MRRYFVVALTVVLLLGVVGCAEGLAQSSTQLAAPEYSESFDSWNALFSEYNRRSMNDTEAFFTDPSSVMLALEMMAGEIELSHTNSFFQPDAAAATTMVLSFFGMSDIVYTEQGDMAIAEAVKSDGMPIKYEVRFDGGNTAILYCYAQGELQSELSLCVADGYAAKVFKDHSKDKPQTLCAIFASNGDVWLGIDAAVLEGTLYQNAAAAEDPSFTTSLSEYYTYIDGVLSQNP